MRKIFSLILVIALISAMFIGTAVQASGTATVTLSSTYAENGQYEVIATIVGGTFTNGDVVLNVGTNVTLKSLISTLDPTAGYSLKNGVLTFSFAPEAAVDCTQAKELFKATFEIAAGVDASAVIVPTLGAETEIQYVEPTSDTPVAFTPVLNTEGFDLIEDVTPPAPTIVYGDINGDGNVNRADLGMLQRYFGGYAEAISATADVNGDGTLNRADLGMLQRYFGGYDEDLGGLAQ